MISVVIALREAARCGRSMSLLLGAFLVILASAAHADKLLPPVRIVQEGFACADISVVKHREQLIANQQTEQLSMLQGVYQFAEGCAFTHVGRYMFYEGYDATSNGAFVCLRMRPGSDCYWMKRSVIGEIPTSFPGRKITEGNKGISCDAWAKLIKTTSEQDKANHARYMANRPSGDGNPVTEMAQGFVTSMLATVTGGPDSHRARSLNLCENYLLSAQQQARRLTAYDWCPQLIAPDKLAAEKTYYRTNIAEIANSCLGNK